MSSQRRFSIFSLIVPILLTLILALVFSCGEQPTAIEQKPEDGGDLTGSGEIDPAAGGSFLLGSVTDSTFARGYIEVWAMDVAYDESTGIVSFDVQLHNKTEEVIPPPIHFVIFYIMPRNIALVEFDGVTGDVWVISMPHHLTMTEEEKLRTFMFDSRALGNDVR